MWLVAGNPEWGSWTSWECIDTCGVTVEFRNRTCEPDPAVSHPCDVTCPGKASEEIECYAGCCPRESTGNRLLDKIILKIYSIHFLQIRIEDDKSLSTWQRACLIEIHFQNKVYGTHGLLGNVRTLVVKQLRPETELVVHLFPIMVVAMNVVEMPQRV